MLGQQGAVILGQVGHLREIAHAPVIDPLPDLPQPHLGLLFRRAGRDQRLAQLIARQADDVGLAPLGSLRGRVSTSCVMGAVGGADPFGGLVTGDLRDAADIGDSRQKKSAPLVPGAGKGRSAWPLLAALFGVFHRGGEAAQREGVLPSALPRPDRAVSVAVVPAFIAASSLASSSALPGQAHSPSVNSW
jgi:hypothetical protein